MKAIKGLVLFMGLLLVAGLGLLGYGLYTKAGQLGKGRAAPAAPVAANDGAGFGTVSVPLPAGARVEQMMLAGDRVVLRLTGGGPDRILILDPLDGSVAGQFELTPEAPRK